MPLTNDECLEIFGSSRIDLIRTADAHTLSVQAWLSSRSPIAKTFQGTGIKASSTGLKLPLLNLAFGANFPDETDPFEIESEVKQVIDFFAERNVPWYWWMNAEPRPANIATFLEKFGCVYDAPPLPAMIAPTKQVTSSFPQVANNVYVWQASSIKDLQMASTIRRIAFQFTEGEALTYFEDMAQDWLSNKNPVRLFLAGPKEGEAVSIGAIIEAEGIPGIYVMATLPEFHRQGYGKAVLTRLLSEAAKCEGKIVALTASSAGAGLYAQFGFRHLFDFNFYSIPDEV
ncbi:MAG: GNAT family N-acetyltransferase [Anaerolineales bacterium]